MQVLFTLSDEGKRSGENDFESIIQKLFQTLIPRCIKMKKLILFTGIIVYVFFAVSIFLDRPERVSDSSVVQMSATQQSLADETPETLYIVKISDGRVAVEDNRTGELVTKTDTLVSVLPKSDRKQLKKGIAARSEREVRTILEDLCS